MNKIQFLAAAAALAAGAVTGTAAQAAPITYTFSGDFSGTFEGNDFTDTPVTFTALGDTSALSYNGYSYNEQLTSLTASAVGTTFTITTPSFFYINSGGFAGLEFGAFDDSEFFSGQNASLVGYDGSTSVATTALSPTSFDFGYQATVMTDHGTATLTGESNATFAASTTAAVPESATWAMMIGGIGLVGGMMRRAYRKSEEAFTARVRALATA